MALWMAAKKYFLVFQAIRKMQIVIRKKNSVPFVTGQCEYFRQSYSKQNSEIKKKLTNAPQKSVRMRCAAKRCDVLVRYWVRFLINPYS